ncbi:MAG: helix-turn-helix transcriptional regulator [Legionella sp.]|nr:helix-turn-helix transcriptional regulator [Legionella sp.]
MNEPGAILPTNLYNLPKIHQLSESELANHLQVPYNTIHRLISGITFDPRISTLRQIANYFPKFPKN